MKVSGNGFEFSAANSLLSVGPAASGAKSDPLSSDAADVQDFGSILAKGASAPGSVAQPPKPISKAIFAQKQGPPDASKGALAAVRVKSADVKPGGALSKSTGGASASQRDTAAPSVGQVSGKDTNLSGTPRSSGPQDDASESNIGESLLSGASDLPPDPRLVDPTELAMEAAAVAALAASAAPLTEPASSDVQDSSPTLDVSVSGGSSGEAGSSGAFLSQLALRSLQDASLTPAAQGGGVALAPQAAQGAGPFQKVETHSEGGVPAAQIFSDAVLSVPVQDAASEKLPVLSDTSVQPEAGLLPDATAVVQVASLKPESVPQASLISSPLISLAATPSELAALVAASMQKLKGQPGGAVSEKADPPVAAQVSTTRIEVGSLAEAAAAAGSQQASPAGKEANFADKNSSAPASPAVMPAASSVPVQSEDKPALSSGGGKGEGDKAASKDGGEAISDAPRGIASPAYKAAPKSSGYQPKPEAQSGTLGASEELVPREETPVKSHVSVETLPASSDEVSQISSSVEHSDSNTASVGTGFISTSRPSSELVSKPTVLPPVQARANEVWRVVQDAVQRARSENPSHLAVEVRMDDGTTLGVELRMSSAGLQASFRSDSQSLLRSIEAQWSAFVSKEPADARVTSAIFESRSGFGGSTDSGASGGERRQQMEDASTAASLGRFSQTGSASASSATAKSAPVQVQNGRISAYA